MFFSQGLLMKNSLNLYVKKGMIRGDVVKSLSGVNIMKLKINIFFMGTILLVQAVMAENLPSSPANPPMPVGAVPSAPRSVGVLNGNAQLLVTWLAPVSTGGSPITDYLVKYWKSGATGWTNFVHPVSAATSLTVTGLTNDTSYVIKVIARNAVGISPPSANSAPATPAATVPGAPTAVVAVSGNAELPVSWIAPAITGGSPITDYLVNYSSDSGSTWTNFVHHVSTATFLTVTGLTNDTSYVIKVFARNAVGISPPSANSAPGKPSLLCNPPINTARELAVNDLSVVNDARTIFKGSNLADSHWSFGYLMGRMAGISSDDVAFEKETSDFIRAWLTQFKTATQAENRAPIIQRPDIDLILNAWPKISNTKNLDLSKAPLRLLSIINRLDLRNETQAGEGRFVFGVLDRDGSPDPFTVILEYRLPLTPALTQNAWALKWHELSDFALNTTQYREKLQEVTDLFSDAMYPGLINGNAINQVRTNEFKLGNPWELREFRLNSSGALVQVTVKQTPDFRLDDSRQLQDWVLANRESIIADTHVVPALDDNRSPFLGGTAPTPHPGFGWLANSPSIPSDLRKAFSVNTCNGCHAGDTGTLFLHVTNRLANRPAAFSGFLNTDLNRRNDDMKTWLINNNCE